MDNKRKNELFERALPEIERICRIAHRRRVMSFDEALSFAGEAAWLALDRFDESKGDLVSFLKRRVWGAILDGRFEQTAPGQLPSDLVEPHNDGEETWHSVERLTAALDELEPIPREVVSRKFGLERDPQNIPAICIELRITKNQAYRHLEQAMVSLKRTLMRDE